MRTKKNTEASSIPADIVKNPTEALGVAKEVHEKEGLHTIILCPGFTHADVAALFQALNGKVGITVARGDGPSSEIALPALQKNLWSSK